MYEYFHKSSIKMKMRAVFMLSLLLSQVFTEDASDAEMPIVKRETISIEGQERSCMTKNYIDEMFLNLENAVDECKLNGNEYATKEDISALRDDISDLQDEINMYMLEKLPRDCEDIQNIGQLTTGVYTIYPHHNASGILVRCDMDTTTGGWTLIQRRVSYSDFYRNWQAYEDGFGSLTGNFWLGNKYIHWLTRQGRYTLRVDLTTNGGQTAYAEYREFTISNAKAGYRMYVKGFSGTAGDSLTANGNGMKFSTKDRDNDIYGPGNCAVMYHGAWWYDKCHSSNLNGDYGNTAYAKGPVWRPLTGFYAPVKTTEMKIRRISN